MSKLRALLEKAGAKFDANGHLVNAGCVFDMGIWGSEREGYSFGNLHHKGSPPFISGDRFASAARSLAPLGLSLFYLADEYRTSKHASRTHTEATEVTEITSIDPKLMKQAIKTAITGAGGFFPLLQLVQSSNIPVSDKQRVALEATLARTPVVAPSSLKKESSKARYIKIGYQRRQRLIQIVLRRYIRSTLSDDDIAAMHKSKTWRLKGVKADSKSLCTSKCAFDCCGNLRENQDVFHIPFHPIKITRGDVSVEYLYLINRDVAAVQNITIRAHAARSAHYAQGQQTKSRMPFGLLRPAARQALPCVPLGSTIAEIRAGNPAQT